MQRQEGKRGPSAGGCIRSPAGTSAAQQLQPSQKGQLSCLPAGSSRPSSAPLSSRFSSAARRPVVQQRLPRLSIQGVRHRTERPLVADPSAQMAVVDAASTDAAPGVEAPAPAAGGDGAGRQPLLLYIGAGWDALVVAPLAQRHSYTRFVFVDALPALQARSAGGLPYRTTAAEKVQGALGRTRFPAEAQPFSALAGSPPPHAMQPYPPGSNGWRNSRDVGSLLAAVRRRLEHLGCRLEEESAPAQRLHTIWCSGAVNARLDYFYSTRVGSLRGGRGALCGWGGRGRLGRLARAWQRAVLASDPAQGHCVCFFVS